MVNLPKPNPKKLKKTRFRNWHIEIGRDISFLQLLKCLTFQRLWNAGQVCVSFVISAISKKTIVWGVPPILTVEPTNICNLRCPLCVTGNGTMRRPLGHLDFPTFQHLIDELANKIIYIILYHQGEPYINKHFLEFVRYAKQQRLYVTTSTNAHYFDRKTAEETVNSRLDTIIVSIDGITQESYEEYRKGGSLEKVIRGLRILTEAKKEINSKTPYIYIQFIVMKHNEYELSELKKMAKELGADRLLLKTLQVKTVEEAQVWLPENQRFRRYHLSQNGFTIKHHGKGKCPQPWLNTVINWDGTVVPCCFDKNGYYTIGDINDPTIAGFSEIWCSEKYTEFRQTMLMDRQSINICRNCNQGIGLFI